MTDRLSAYVVAASGADFTCEIANLTPRSLFLRTEQRLGFRERVSVTFFSVEVEGEVALSSESPLGLMVVFEAPPAVQRRIEARMTMPDPIPEMDDGPATELIDVEVELWHGLTSHAGQRPASRIAQPAPQTVQARPKPREAQETKLDNPVVPTAARKPKSRDQQTTDLDPAV